MKERTAGSDHTSMSSMGGVVQQVDIVVRVATASLVDATLHQLLLLVPAQALPSPHFSECLPTRDVVLLLQEGHAWEADGASVVHSNKLRIPSEGQLTYLTSSYYGSTDGLWIL